MGDFDFITPPNTTADRGAPLSFAIADTSGLHSGMQYMCSLTTTAIRGTSRAGEITAFVNPSDAYGAEQGPVVFHFNWLTFQYSGDYRLHFHVQRMAPDLQTFEVVDILTHTMTIY
ncbi:hypothetical protein HOO65_060290 [Ceratocystis lukuohia]|uniref:Uncharacterized protein n=3 Tax=Ceratocystis TaxID=5157 RepID=A0A0F8CT11_CERFI|nr:hypothetical protein CFO_g3771 [Ceratocystis platani]PHH55479.1 hypothetical protein CFIMG_007290RA00001 [Ceratocystis fimbriata CBS 114723]